MLFQHREIEVQRACVFYFFINAEIVFIPFSSFLIISVQQGTRQLIWREDQKPLRFEKKKKTFLDAIWQTLLLAKDELRN
jgi:hypothetical protein